jgi:Cof subfamily protein (haloacid dehalogenase superfamily)
MTPALVISDVDGTLVTSDKRLTPRSCAAVEALRRNGIRFTVVTSRPPFGVRMVAEPLGLDIPFAVFNGGMIVEPNLMPVEQHLVGADAARQAIALLDAGGVDVWLFTAGAWHVRDPRGVYTEQERRTVLTEPVVVHDFDALLPVAGKVVGVSAEFARLDELESMLVPALEGHATVARSQPYYLDVTPYGHDKGTAVEALLGFLGVSADQLVVLGDMENDLPMFRIAAFSIAMGNAAAAVKQRASAVALGNDADGFADAIERFVLARVEARP